VPLARTYSVALVGVVGHVVKVEVDIAKGLVGMILVGLPTPRWSCLPSNAGPFCDKAPGNYHGLLQANTIFCPTRSFRQYMITAVARETGSAALRQWIGRC
jgi:hypothetical protein